MEAVIAISVTLKSLYQPMPGRIGLAKCPSRTDELDALVRILLSHNAMRWVIVMVMFGLLLIPPVYAGDWPQILGPERNGHATNELPLKPWSEAGPKVLWSHQIGNGYAGPAVVGGQAVVFHRVGDMERVEALDSATGTRRWKADFPATYTGGMNPDKGPRCVPLIHGNHVYVFGSAGSLHCVKLDDGTKQWSREVVSEFHGSDGYFGAASTPIVADDKLLVNVGGQGAGLVAFDLNSGEMIWKTTDEQASYSSPISTAFRGQQHVIFLTRLNVVSVDPRSGTVRFRFPFGRSGPTVNAATPLIFGDHLFVTAAYGIGAQVVRIDRDPPTQVWANDTVISSQYTTCVYHKGFLYGTHGREDFANGELRCLTAITGKLQWSVKGFGIAHLILVENQLLILTTDGKLYLARASPNGFLELARRQLTTKTTRALPSLSNGRFYFRDNDSTGGRLRCLALSSD